MRPNTIHHKTSHEYIHEIISMDHDPILRNLKITQCYADLSQGIAMRVGDENVNWCHFATWASKTAGRFIRLENMNVQLHDALHHNSEYQDWLLLIKDKFYELDIEHEFEHAHVHTAAHNSISVISADIAAGNLKVFSELGIVFSSMIDAFDKSLRGNRDSVESLVQTLRQGDSHSGGQDLLANAVRDFHAALHEKDQYKKAELMLRANAQTGLHEQIRLQPYIAAAMEAPLPKTFSSHAKKHLTDNIPDHKHHLLHSIFDQYITPITHKVHNAWLNMSTHYLMTLVLPDGVLHLGHDLPKPEGANLFPDHLVNLRDEGLNNLLHQFQAHTITPHCKARNWSVLEDRMHYILNLFRSRQQHRPLHLSPFETLQIEHLHENKMPMGKL
jgi:hypothetical protein